MIEKLLVIAGYLLTPVYLIYCKSWRINIDRSIYLKHQNCIFTFWHEDIFTLLYVFKYSQVAIFILLNRKNIILKTLTKLIGYERVLFHSEARAALKMIHKTKEGFNPGIAEDGPYGPYHIPKGGAFLISKKTSLPIINLKISAKSQFTISSRWDKHKIPLPFACIDVTIAEVSK